MPFCERRKSLSHRSRRPSPTGFDYGRALSIIDLMAVGASANFTHLSDGKELELAKRILFLLNEEPTGISRDFARKLWDYLVYRATSVYLSSIFCFFFFFAGYCDFQHRGSRRMFVPIFRLTSQWAVTWAGYDSISAEDQRSLLPNVKKCSLLSAFGSIFGFWNTLFLLSVYVFGGMVWFLFNIFDGHEQNVQYLEVRFCCFFQRLFIWNYQSSFLFSIDTSVYGFVVRARGLGFGMLESGMIGCDSALGSDKVFVLNTTKLFCFRNLKFTRKQLSKAWLILFLAIRILWAVCNRNSQLVWLKAIWYSGQWYGGVFCGGGVPFPCYLRSAAFLLSPQIFLASARCLNIQ